MIPDEESRESPEGRDPETTDIITDRVSEGVREKNCP